MYCSEVLQTAATTKWTRSPLPVKAIVPVSNKKHAQYGTTVVVHVCVAHLYEEPLVEIGHVIHPVQVGGLLRLNRDRIQSEVLH